MKFIKPNAVWMWTIAIALIMMATSPASADTVTTGKDTINEKDIYRLGNNQVKASVTFHRGYLDADCLEAQPEWLSSARPGGKLPPRLVTDGDFGLEVQWTDWQAPGKLHNADNPIMLTKKYFQLVRAESPDTPDGCKEWVFTFNSGDLSLEIQLIYRLERESFVVKRRLAVRDPKRQNHFLRWLWPRRSCIHGKVSILKAGGFGNPLALTFNDAGAFFGLEYPAAENCLKPIDKEVTALHTGQEMGMKIDDSRVYSEWSAAGLSPDSRVKLWFNRYLDSVRVAPLKPYLLYNSWYDVRAPEYTQRPEDVMNEANLLRIINDFKREMKEKRGLQLDAFVLDDGWDIYKSDWVLRPNEFPHGLAPIKNALKEMGSGLGIWFGPIGGYSHRNWRVDWMKEHGYEVVGDQMCLAGTHYHQLFKKRTTDFARDDGVAYYKWDGIQFSCSEPDHGHPVDVYSRRAVMEAVVDLCQAVRAENPGIFLNITSGTWLSPWWMKYANMIWMQGEDYGYADVPSISKRDAAITYRDVVLYENYGVNDYWFPISNLMTHGIIKGHLQKLGGEAEPLDKFTNDVILYFARGVTMWELYISPNLLTDGEWDALAKSVRWARDRFDILKTTEMVGGDPGNREAYGYVHFAGQKGIIAARNPYIVGQTLKVKLDPAHGMDPRAASLVLERVYPTRWVSPDLYAAGAVLELPLSGYETAIYELYPMDEAAEPLLAGATFEVVREKGKEYILNVHGVESRVRILNPGLVVNLKIAGKEVPWQQLRSALPVNPIPETIKPVSTTAEGNGAAADFQVSPSLTAELCFLVEPSASEYLSELKKQEKTANLAGVLYLDGAKVNAEVEQQEGGGWAWYKVKVGPGRHRASLRFPLTQKKTNGAGKISAWVVYTYKPGEVEVRMELNRELLKIRPMPPFNFASGGQEPLL